MPGYDSDYVTKLLRLPTEKEVEAIGVDLINGLVDKHPGLVGARIGMRMNGFRWGARDLFSGAALQGITLPEQDVWNIRIIYFAVSYIARYGSRFWNTGKGGVTLRSWVAEAYEKALAADQAAIEAHLIGGATASEVRKQHDKAQKG